MADITVVIEEYTPTLDEADIEDLINFSTEIFCIKGNSEVENG